MVYVVIGGEVLALVGLFLAIITANYNDKLDRARANGEIDHDR